MTHENFILIVVLLIISISVIALYKKLFKISYLIVLVITALIISMLNLPYVGGLRAFMAEKDILGFIIISIFLPILLEEASLKSSYSHIKENLRAILVVVIPGTLITFIAIGISSKLIFGLSA